jgi:hypothetical protein
VDDDDQSRPEKALIRCTDSGSAQDKNLEKKFKTLIRAPSSSLSFSFFQEDFTIENGYLNLSFDDETNLQNSQVSEVSN